MKKTLFRLFRLFQKEEKANVVAYILVIAAVILGLAAFTPQGKFYIKYWFVEKYEKNSDKALEAMPGTEGTTPGSSSTSAPAAGTPLIGVEVDGVLNAPTIIGTPSDGPSYFFKYNDFVYFEAKMNGGKFYVPREPYTCTWIGYDGYTGPSCNPGQKMMLTFGEHEVKVRMCDGWGACSVGSKKFAYGYMPLSVDIKATPDKTNYLTTDKIAFSSVISGGSKSYQQTWTNYTPPDAVKFSKGSHTITLKVCDTIITVSGFCKEVNKTINIENAVPNEPTLTMTPKPSEGISVSTNVSFNASGSVDPDGGAVTYEWDNKKSNYPVGVHTVKVRAKDELGGYSPYSSVTFEVLPDIELVPNVNLDGKIYSNEPIKFTPQPSTDYNGTLTYEVKEVIYKDDGTYTMIDPPADGKYKPGVHTIAVRAVSSNGGYSEWQFKTFTVDFRVLEVYGHSAQLSSVLQTYGKGKVILDSYSINDFNTKSINVWDYDMLLFGFADCYNGCGSNPRIDLSTARMNDVIAFGDAGRGVLFSHDTYGLTNFHTIIASKMGMNTGVPSLSWWGNTTVYNVKSGMLTNYPWELPPTMSVAPSHYQNMGSADLNNVWITMDKNNTEKGWFIVSNKNWVFTTTGHSIPSAGSLTNAPADEQKMLVNTVFYTSQFRQR